MVKNYERIAHVWLDEPSRVEFYNAHHITYQKGVVPDYVGNFTGGPGWVF